MECSTRGFALTDVKPAAPELEQIDKDVYVDETEGLVIESRSFGRQTWLRFRHHKLAVAGGIVLIVLALAFIVGPMLSPYAYDEVLAGPPREGPSLDHPFGTDDIGRDMMTRTFVAGRFSLRIAIAVALLTTLIGTIIGAAAGYFGGWVDSFLSQVINLFLILPALVLLLVVGIKWGADPDTMAILIAFILWPPVARIVRGLTIQYKEQEFVMAARAAGAGPGRIMVRHIIPNTFGPIIVAATLLVGIAIILESTLSFLGVGVQLPTPTLGNMVNEAKGYIDTAPYRILIPGGFVVLIVLCINYLGDGLRDALDPTSAKVRE
jgi:ABC-type dipeptide/oligopeptide/nickel transport system permease subunit